MNEFEKKIMFKNKNKITVDHDQFLKKLNSRIDITKTKREILSTSFAMIVIVFFLTFTQFGAPDSKMDNYSVYSTDNLLETDFWSIQSDSLYHDQDYYNDIAYFLLDEGYIWEAIELIEKFETREEES